MTEKHGQIIEKIFGAQKENGMWQEISPGHKYYPDYLHYVPNYKASLWTLILLADLRCGQNEKRIEKPLRDVKNHLFDHDYGIYTLKKGHFPIPCLNGNLLYLDCYFNGKPDEKSRRVLDFFCRYQRFDDGTYEMPKNPFCSNTKCFGKHTCYWGIIKLFKGISFIPEHLRNDDINTLKNKCADFILKHAVCYSSRQPGKILSNKIDCLTFPNMYKSDFLEILWLLKREQIYSGKMNKALNLLKSKRNSEGGWVLERKMHNMSASIGEVSRPNPFVTERAGEVLAYYEKKETQK